ncbi:hypothetical protein WPS_18400 [Vulcanimicrobium alpinum]|uniref:Uncharacterized protein n=1 Tax=Vulcanimicrobium alpinum TaxID=3016050 RepID=A0AAN1XX32_UNVUL|nr:hypothetical protein WPS_18400 [Vulcanimicrobium alpinum]
MHVDREMKGLTEVHLLFVDAHRERVDMQRAQTLRAGRPHERRRSRGERERGARAERRYRSTRSSHRANRLRASNGPGDASG